MSAKYNGYAGKILYVDLTTKTATWKPMDGYMEWVGGLGVGIKILYDELKPWVTPYDPANVLVFGTGPMNGTLAPASGRLSAHSKSPMTFGIGSSNAGGFFAPELKYAGFDHVVIKGKADRPVYLWINDGEVSIKDASELWGKTTWETDDIIKSDFGDPGIQTLSIGAAGENLVRGACIMVNKNRALGRCGLGAVMGSKNLKAIAVRGTGSVEVADPDRFIAIVDKMRDSYQESKVIDSFKALTSICAVPGKAAYGGMPYKNFQDMSIPKEMEEAFNPEIIMERNRESQTGCFACPIACSPHYYIKSGPYAGLRTEGTQFESLADFGCKLGIADFDFCIKATSYCNQHGIDVDPVAEAIAWVMECYEKGLISDTDVDGLKPVWGDAGVALELMRKIVFKEGIGNVLSEGVARAADLMGENTKYYAMHIKGQDLYEPLRFSIGWSLGTCVSTRGGGHTTGAPVCEINGKIDDEKAKQRLGVDTYNKPLSYEGKEKLVKYYEMLNRLNSSMGICIYATDWYDAVLPGFSELTELFCSATGQEYSVADLQEAALRMLNLEKVFNYLHAGFDRKDDYPTQRSMEEEVPSGPVKGFKLDKGKWDELLDKYYSMHGWNTSGLPTRSTLLSLGLEFAADDLEKYSTQNRNY